jgi:hypothetical protein
VSLSGAENIHFAAFAVLATSQPWWSRGSMVAVFFLFSFLVWNLPFLGNAKSLPNLKNTIAIFGGTGKLGSECVYQALQRGDNVVVLARDKSKMTIPPGSGGLLAGQSLPDHPQLKLIEGSVTNQKNVDTVFDGNAVTSVIIGESLSMPFP